MQSSYIGRVLLAQSGPIEFNKIAVFFISDDQEIRRAAEDELVRQVQPTESAAAYSLIPESESDDLDKIDSRLKREGFDGAVLMRLVNIETRETWVPGRLNHHTTVTRDIIDT